MTSETSQRQMTREELLDAIQTCRNANCVECRYKDVGGPCLHTLLEDISIAIKPVDELVEAIRHCITKDCVNCPYAIKGCERAMLKDTLALLEGEME